MVERRGVIRVRNLSGGATGALLDIRSIVRGAPDSDAGNEQGLLSLAFAPDYASSRYFYVLFTNRDGDVEIDEFQRSLADPARADPESRRTVLTIPHRFAQNHNGGQLNFGPGGLLFASIGDGGRQDPPGEQARNLDVLLGKLLRIDPRPHAGQAYRVPPSNPFVGRPGRDEIYAYGLRNPFRFSFDGGRLAIGDVGQRSFEEVDFLRAGDALGANFGWPQYEGFEPFDESRPGPDPPTFPAHTYAHDPGCSVIGGYVIRDPSLTGLVGRYLYTDFCSGELRTFLPRLNEQGEFRSFRDRTVGLTLIQPTTFGVDAAGRIYVAELSGEVSRLEPAGA